MVARLIVQRLVDTALNAAGAVPRGMAVAQQREACGNQRCRSMRSGASSAVRAARAAGSRCSAAILSRPLRPAASRLSDIGDQRIDRFGVGTWIVGRNQPAAFANDIPDASPVLGQSGAALRLRLQIDHAERLADAGPDKKVSGTKLAGDAVLIECAEKRHLVRKPRKQRLHLRPRRPIADDSERPGLRLHKSQRRRQRLVARQLIPCAEHRTGK